MTIVYGVCFAFLAVAACLSLLRVERGPSMFDRIVALDIFVAIVIGTLAVLAAITGRTDMVPVFVVLALVGFLGSVSIARFAGRESADEARILTKEEFEAILAEREEQSDDAPPVHDVDGLAIVAVLPIPQAVPRPARQSSSVSSPADTEDALAAGRSTRRQPRDDSDPSEPAASDGGAP